MRRLLLSATVIVGVGWVGLAPALATSLGLPAFNGSSINATQVEKVGYWRRLYRRYGYPGPYAYYPPPYSYYPPPVYGYQPPPPAYAYSPPVYGNQALPPTADGNYPTAEGDYGDYPPAEGGDYGDYPANGS